MHHACHPVAIVLLTLHLPLFSKSVALSVFFPFATTVGAKSSEGSNLCFCVFVLLSAGK